MCVSAGVWFEKKLKDVCELKLKRCSKRVKGLRE